MLLDPAILELCPVIVIIRKSFAWPLGGRLIPIEVRVPLEGVVWVLVYFEPAFGPPAIVVTTDVVGAVPPRVTPTVAVLLVATGVPLMSMPEPVTLVLPPTAIVVPPLLFVVVVSPAAPPAIDVADPLLGIG